MATNSRGDGRSSTDVILRNCFASTLAGLRPVQNTHAQCCLNAAVMPTMPRSSTYADTPDRLAYSRVPFVHRVANLLQDWLGKVVRLRNVRVDAGILRHFSDSGDDKASAAQRHREQTNSLSL